jgi:DNA polymerase-4/DNA polymerase V
MENTPLMTMSWPRAILHIDADAFFTSVEQALDPALRGRPVVTGKERGIIACASYEAKAMGIKRGITLSDARTLCPQLIVLPSDYETYSLYSRRMFNIMRQYTPVVEEYSVDEAFADIAGLRRIFRTSYPEIARKIKTEIHAELGITVSVGLSLSKCLAKLCSKFRKPDGLTAVEGRHIHLLLQRTDLEKVWGFGPNSVNLLQKLGLKTAYDYVRRPERWAGRILHKPGREIWNELRGHSVLQVTPEEKTSYATIIKSKTFTPAVSDKAFVHARLIRNVESALMKARRYKLRPRTLGVVLRHHDFRHDGLEARLNRPTSSSIEALPLIRMMFDKIFLEGSKYRSTMIVLGGLESDESEQFELFEDRLKIDSLRRATEAIDAINRKYGKHTLCSASALFLKGKPENSRDAHPPRREMVLRGETPRQRLEIPRMSIAV